MLGFLSVARPKALLIQWIQLLSSPTSFYLAFLLSLQIVALVTFALTVPIGIRYLVLPSSIQQEIPLNLVFLPCEDNLHGVCSFPTAQINVNELDVFSPSTYYQISIRLHFSDAETNFNLGMFQNELNLLDARGANVGRWRRTGLLKQPGYFIKSIRIFFFPLYFLGFFHNYHVMEIPIAGEYYAAADKMAQQLTYSLQDRFAQVDTAYLLVNAKFGFIRNFLYNWPLTTFFFLFIATLMSGVFVMAIFWGHKGYTTYTGSRERTAESSRRTSEEIGPVTEGQFLPDYSECPTSSENVAGWKKVNVISVANTPPVGLRNRKSNPYYT